MPVAEVFVSVVQPWVPTWVLRVGVRWYLRWFGGWQLRGGDAVARQIACDRVARPKEPVTILTKEANEQHYGNDPAFFQAHLGPALKYSACIWPDGCATLEAAEKATLADYQKRLGLDFLDKGSTVLELGMGWGSLCLNSARAYPSLHFVAFSNSPEQVAFVRSRAPSNLRVERLDYADFVRDQSILQGPFDAAVAVETVEHTRNVGALLAAVGRRLRPGAKFFVHSLLHQTASYLVDDRDWMGRNFFSGGSILALNSYPLLLPDTLRLVDIQPVPGTFYSRTLLAWLTNLERRRKDLVPAYGRPFYEGFRMFYVVCVEAFAANHGFEYLVGYYSFVKV